MPNQDKTGPDGRGPLTGRGLGPCNARQIVGRGLRRGFGRRAGFCPVETEPIVLTEKEEEEILEAEKAEIDKRLKELKTK